LIDTGAKTCIGDQPVRLFNHSFDTAKEYAGLTPQYLSHKIGCRIDYLIGLDVLAKWPWTIDWPKKAITFHLNGEHQVDGVRVPLQKHLAPHRHPEFGEVYWLDVNFRLNGRSIKALFDTGCPIGGFFPWEEKSDEPQFRGFRDFFPTIGWFKTDLYRRKIDLEGKEFNVDFGVLPEEIRYQHPVILGNPILRDGSATIDVPGGALWLPRKEVSCN